MPRSRTYVDCWIVSVIGTSPKIWKSFTPTDFAAAIIFGIHSRQKPALTWRAVSTRKPSSLYFVIQSE